MFGIPVLDFALEVLGIVLVCGLLILALGTVVVIAVFR